MRNIFQLEFFCSPSSGLQLFVLSLFPLAALAAPSADPSYGHGPQCTTTYETIYTKQCATSYEKACTQDSKTKYQTAYDTKCETITTKNCFPVPKKIPDQECGTVYDEVCTKETQKTYKTGYDQQCKDVVKEVSIQYV